MTDKEFNSYLKKYSSKYSNIKRDEAGTWKIDGKWGEIGPYDSENHELAVWCMKKILLSAKAQHCRASLDSL